MLVKKLAAALAATALLAGAGFSQVVKPAQITVSKNKDQNADRAMFTTIQAAVNAANPGDIIEITDTEVYEEQVTIDSTKHGITIRSKNPTSLTKPTIKYQDRTNQSPKNFAESEKPGDTPGTSGNFETCGALRIKRAQGVTIDGIAVDGGGPAPFAWSTVWENKNTLAHGNAAITLVVAGGAKIRNCDLRNAYIGLNVKDRNTGGVFGNPNPADNDSTIPLSGFGKVGNHLIEYNRIHDNSLGIFFESAWDLGSTVRYNLIYNNFHIQSVLTFIATAPADERDNMKAAGAIMFKDMVYTPVAIYNNTFYNNMLNLIGHWKIAAPHLLFNNIFGKSSVPVIADGGNENRFDNRDFMAMDMRFQYRMHNSVTSAYLKIDAQGQSVYFDYNCTPSQYDTLWVSDITVWNQYPKPTPTAQDIFAPGCSVPKSQDMVLPGALLSAGATGYPNSANVRWLEMSGATVTSKQVAGKSLTLPNLFQSTDPTDPKFLWPNWEHQYVKDFIQNKGWEDGGIRNADGKIADIGAISSYSNNAKQPTTVRIKPSNVVLISGGQATASFFLTLENGTMNNPKVKLVRWIAPIPGPTNFGGSDAPMVAQSAIRDITQQVSSALSSLKFGANTFNFPLSGDPPEYGFFEIVIEGTDANGNTVTSDVGFLPYRELEYSLKIEVYPLTGDKIPANALVEIKAGEQYRVEVTPQGSKTQYQGILDEVEYQLLSDPTARMWRQITPELGNPLVSDLNMPSPQGRTYEVYFTKAGDEVIFGSGVSNTSGGGRLVFLGNRAIKVLPGDADKVAFKNPIPLTQLGTPPGPAPVINRGVDFPVMVEVQDKWGNIVGANLEVSISSTKTHIGDVGVGNNLATKTARTDEAGVAHFTARVTNGQRDSTFDMIAVLVTDVNKKDTGRLRVGRTLDYLQVFYSDAGAPGNREPDGSVGINAATGEWVLVTVKAVAPDSVITSKGGAICVTPNAGLQLSASPDGSAPGATAFPMVNGVATFYVSAENDVNGGCVSVSKLEELDCSKPDHSVLDGSRCDITFERPATNIDNAVVYGDGEGRPDSVIVRYKSGFEMPDSIVLRWPTPASAGIAVSGDRIRLLADSLTLSVNFRGVTGVTPFPVGYTGISGNGRGLVSVWTKGVEERFFDVLDGIGPVIADGGNGIADMWSPLMVENLDPATVADTLIIKISEQIGDAADLQGVSSIFYSATSNTPATGGDALSVQTAMLDLASSGGYKLVLPAGAAVRPQVGGWIRFNPSSSVCDMSDLSNGPHLNNRWVQLKEKQVPPEVTGAYYTSNVMTGLLDYAYITFNKDVVLADWFVGGYFRFGSGADSAAVGSDPSRFLSLVDGDARTVRVDLSVAYPGSQGAIRTNGGMSVSIGFNPGQLWDAKYSVAIADRAKPVLAMAAVLRIGASDDQPDTLEIIYSEPLSDDALRLANPVEVILKTGAKRMPVLGTPVTSNVSGTSFQKVTYVVEPGSLGEGQDFPTIGDSVTIYIDAGVADRGDPPNVQNLVNRKVPLEIQRGSIRWDVIVKNNPFKGGSGSAAAVELSPNVKGATVRLKYSIRLYDNLGNLVIHDKDLVGEDMAEWQWNGQNKKGRMAGTGTYLFKAVCDAEVMGADRVTVEKKERYSVTRSIGFVR